MSKPVDPIQPLFLKLAELQYDFELMLREQLEGFNPEAKVIYSETFCAAYPREAEEEPREYRCASGVIEGRPPVFSNVIGTDEYRDVPEDWFGEVPVEIIRWLDDLDDRLAAVLEEFGNNGEPAQTFYGWFQAKISFNPVYTLSKVCALCDDGCRLRTVITYEDGTVVYGPCRRRCEGC